MTQRHELAGARRLVPGVHIAACTCGFETPGLPKRIRAVRYLERHIKAKSKPPPPRCPTPNKTKFRDQQRAEQVLTGVWKRGRPGSRLPARSYLCVCGYWHLTKERERK
ncbi:hypothetical protein [Nocardia sp. NPDC005745]|uniref:hypothetical protein n=1 Tax=Nocardia sp. NPDC005745 TaxID=3157061 RepID=UPI0034066558